MAQTRYAFRGVNIFQGLGVDAQAVGEELEELIDTKQEHVTPEEIVARARRHDSAMRGAFTWDMAEAAAKWQRHEARQITTDLVIAQNKKATKTRAFVYVHHPEHGGKKVLLSHRSAMGRPEMREQLIEQGAKSLQRTLKSWSGQYGATPELKRLSKNVAALRKLVERQLMAAV